MRIAAGSARAAWNALLTVILLALPGTRAEAQFDTYTDAAVKAAFLYHFGTYVEWPAADPTTGITIAVIGDDRVFDQLAEYLPGRTIAERPVTTRSIDSVDELGDEQIVFFGRQHQGRLETLVEEAIAPGRLIVTDWFGLVAGAAINLLVVDDRVRFEISRPAADTVGLALSSRLLSAAYRVDDLPTE
jgi:hypothetical protein